MFFRRLLLLVLLIFASAAAAAAQPLLSGPLVGHSEPSQTWVWLQTRYPASVQLRFWPSDRPQDARLSAPIQTRAEKDHIALFPISDLPTGRRFTYEVYVDGNRTEFAYPLEFQTQAADATRNVRDLRCAIGSCAVVEPGLKAGWGDDYEIFQSIDQDKPDFMLWLGDNIYYRGTDWMGEESMRTRNRVDRATLTTCWPLWARTHHYAIWDDHDYGPNDSDDSFQYREAALRVFKDYWPGATYGGGGRAPGVFYRFNWGDVDFFMLDVRYHRSPLKLPDGPRRGMLGRAQMDWLKDSLANSRASFKIVAGGSQMMNPLVVYEGWGRYPQERQELLDFIRDARIEGVVFLSGDRHTAELVKVQPQGLYPLYDYTSSPLTSGLHVEPREKDNPARIPGTWVNTTRNYGILEVSGPAGERRLRMFCKNVQGKVVWQYDISQKELSFPKP